jgi:flagellar biosynthesis component FlhA
LKRILWVKLFYRKGDGKMEDRPDVPEKMNVVVELDDSLKRFNDSQTDESNTFRKYLLRSLNDLIADLRIPMEISLDVKTGEDSNKFLMTLYQVYLNDRRCRFQLPSIVDQDVNAKKLALSIAKAIYQNRELFITVPLAQKVRKMWSSDKEVSKIIREKYSSDLSGENFQKFLINFVRRGFSVERGKKISLNLGDTLKESEYQAICFEKIISPANLISLKVFIRNREVIQRSAAFNLFDVDPFVLLQDTMFDELGLILPEITIEIDDSLEDNAFRVQLNDIRLPPSQGLAENEFIVDDTPENLSSKKINGERFIFPLGGSLFSIVKNTDSAFSHCKEAENQIWCQADFIAVTIISEIRINAGNFLTSDILRFDLDQLSNSHAALVDATLRSYDILLLTQIMRELLDEGISIRYLRLILESLLAINATLDNDQKNKPDYLSDLSRISLRRYISNKYSSSENSIGVYLLDNNIESKMLHEEKLSENDRDQFIKKLFEKLGKDSSRFPYPLIMTTFKVRKKVRDLIKNEFPFVPIICPEELEPGLSIQSQSQISL